MHYSQHCALSAVSDHTRAPTHDNYCSTTVTPHVTSLTRLSRFSACNIEKLGVAWGRGYIHTHTHNTHTLSLSLSLTHSPYLINYSTHKFTHSDIDIVLADRRMPGHRFVLAARSRRWNQDETLTSTSELDLSHMTPYVAGSMIRWVYTDSIILPSDQTAMIELLSAANKYHLLELKEK